MEQMEGGNHSTTKAEIGKSLFKAIREGNPEEVEDLLKQVQEDVDELRKENGEEEKASLGALSGAESISASGGTLLHAAVRRGSLPWVEKLVGMGADPSLPRDAKGYTPLRLAERMVELDPMDNNYKAILSMLRRMAVEVTSIRSSSEYLDKALAEIRNGYSSINSTLSEIRDNQKPSDSLIRELVENCLVRMETLFAKPFGILTSLESHAMDLKQTVGIMKIRSDEENEKKYCINQMMLKTTIRDVSLENKEFVKELYTNLYECGVLTSSLLHYLKRDDSLRVSIDCSSENIMEITFPSEDLDVEVYRGYEDAVYAGRQENRVYLAALRTRYIVKEIIWSRFARTLAIVAINNLYHNAGRPYSDGDVEIRAAFQEALAEAVAKKDKIPGNVLYVSWAVRMDSSLGKEARLAAVPAEYVAEYGSVKGRALLKDHVPKLLQFYEENVLPKLK